jgi:hypothetical protein
MMTSMNRSPEPPPLLLVELPVGEAVPVTKATTALTYPMSPPPASKPASRAD